MLEKNLEAACYKLAAASRCLFPKFSGARGWPDRLLVRPGKPLVLVELKVGKGRLTPLQARIHARLAELGHTVVIVRTLDDMRALLA